jgi:hypothetical protein
MASGARLDQRSSGLAHAISYFSMKFVPTPQSVLSLAAASAVLNLCRVLVCAAIFHITSCRRKCGRSYKTARKLECCEEFRDANIFAFVKHLKERHCEQCTACFRQMDEELRTMALLTEIKKRNVR